MGGLLLPFVILISMYCSYLGEPSEYTRMKQTVEEHQSQIAPLLLEKITLEENDDPTTNSMTSTMKNKLYDVYRIHEKSLVDIGPLQSGGYVNEVNFPLNNKEQIQHFLAELYPERVQYCHSYFGKEPLDREQLIPLLDQVVEWELSYEEHESIRPPDFEFLKYHSWCDLLILAAYRAHLTGDQELCHRLYTRYTQIMLDHSVELSFYWVVQFPGFMWACYDFGLLSNQDLLELKSQIIEKHEEIRIEKQSGRRLLK